MSSSRRSSGEVNILAMLDGLGARPPARRTLLWCGAGGLLCCALVGALAWLAHDPAPVQQPVVALALPAPPVTAAGSMPAQGSAPAAAAVAQPAAPHAPSGGATIVNLPSLSGPNAEPALAAAALPDAPHAASHPAPHSAPAPQHAPTTRAALLREPGRTGVAAVHGAAHPAAKRRAGASRTTADPAAVDTDVALISAIMQHAANGRDGAPDAGCGDQPCAPHTPMRP
ncbi:hypothetical protein [Massilia sp. 9096]|uniref:hypothetical protein n=1 Tax=Massilia sp. 9096 TaxID=1500894 RepID=UPI00056D29EA|nr:hypothetical protein [Massilia sp. 9096]